MIRQVILFLCIFSAGIRALDIDDIGELIDTDETSVENLLTCADICVCANVTGNVVNSTLAHRPVVLLHGLLGANVDLTELSVRIQQAHPGTLIFNLNCFSRLASKGLLWKQVRKIGAEVIAIGSQFPDGINLVGHGQGGLIGRALLQLSPNHKVRNFVSVNAPQAGYCGTSLLPCKNAHKFYYTKWGQLSAIGNSWNDPMHHDEYLDKNIFLPIINNERQTNASAWLKIGLTKLQHLVLIGGPQDEVIKPWQSSQFGFWKNNDTAIVELRNRTIYQTDAIGLKTLDTANKLILHTVPNVTHAEWLWNTTLIDKYILPYLD